MPPAAAFSIRPVKPTDRPALLAKLDSDPRIIDSPSQRIHVAEENGNVVGLSIWLQPDAGEEALLGNVIAPPDRWDIFYRLIKAAIEDALAQGFTRGRSTIYDKRVLEKLQRDFDIEVQPSGWVPNTRVPTQWDMVVDLAGTIEKLDRVL